MPTDPIPRTPPPNLGADLDHFPAFEADPSYYTDYGETQLYTATIGDSECAT